MNAVYCWLLKSVWNILRHSWRHSWHPVISKTLTNMGFLQLQSKQHYKEESELKYGWCTVMIFELWIRCGYSIDSLKIQKHHHHLYSKVIPSMILITAFAFNLNTHNQETDVTHLSLLMYVQVTRVLYTLALVSHLAAKKQSLIWCYDNQMEHIKVCTQAYADIHKRTRRSGTQERRCLLLPACSISHWTTQGATGRSCALCCCCV